MSKNLAAFLILFLVYLSLSVHPAHAQAGLNDDRVMIQGFYWESHRYGHSGFPAFGSKPWYQIVQEQASALREARFDMVWLPPPLSGISRAPATIPKSILT